MSANTRNQIDQVDPLDGSQPRASTFAERQTVAVLGALAIVAAVAVLVLVLGRGATPVSAADELAAARHPAAGSASTKNSRTTAASTRAAE
jgi:hypothetical protein